MTTPLDVEGLKRVAEAAMPTFGDLVENGWASEDNPTRRGYFVRAFKRIGRMNPGLTWEITNGKGKFWELQPRVVGERLTVTPAALVSLKGGGGSSCTETASGAPSAALASETSRKSEGGAA